jgi:hypothetical protein
MALGEYIGAGAGITKGLYHLNGNSNDASGNGNNGTDSNITYSLANGKLGQGAGFNGTSSYINLSYSGLNVFTFTISFWWNKNGNQGAFVGVIGNTDNTGNQYYGWSFWEYLNVMYISIKGSSGAGAYQINFGSSSLGDWHLYTVTCASSGGAVNSYLDGNLINSGTAPSWTYAGNNTKIGKNNTGNSKGNMDELIIENVVWTPSQIKKYYTYSKGRFGL